MKTSLFATRILTYFSVILLACFASIIVGAKKITTQKTNSYESCFKINRFSKDNQLPSFAEFMAMLKCPVPKSNNLAPLHLSDQEDCATRIKTLMNSEETMTHYIFYKSAKKNSK